MKVTTLDLIVFKEVDVAVLLIIFAEAPTTQSLP